MEHTVTEAVLGLDLVRIQLEIAAGRDLAELGLTQAEVPRPRGTAVQARVNLETMTAEGQARPSGGVIGAFEPPSGPGVRVDHFGYAGYRTSGRYDSLLAKLIVHAQGGLSEALTKTRRALAEFKITGPQTNIPFLEALLAQPEVIAGEADTRFIERHHAGADRRAGARPGSTSTRLRPSHPLRAAPAPASTRSIRSPSWRTARLSAPKIATRMRRMGRKERWRCARPCKAR